MQPVFPVHVLNPQRQIKQRFEDVTHLETDLEFFDSEGPSEETIVLDALGRRVRLVVYRLHVEVLELKDVRAGLDDIDSLQKYEDGLV